VDEAREGGAPRDRREEAREAADLPPDMDVREEDLEPHEGLRYIARLFKLLAILLLLLMVGEIILGLIREGESAIPALLVEATRLIVFAAFLWAAGDLALMLIESNHDLRATRILVGRLNAKVARIEGASLGGQGGGGAAAGGGGPGGPRPPSHQEGS
jgi:hypothetical protein